jgi:hypothetical protein
MNRLSADIHGSTSSGRNNGYTSPAGLGLLEKSPQECRFACAGVSGQEH